MNLGLLKHFEIEMNFKENENNQQIHILDFPNFVLYYLQDLHSSITGRMVWYIPLCYVIFPFLLLSHLNLDEIAKERGSDHQLQLYCASV